MRKKQICKVCEEKLLLTEITTDTGNEVWAYLCGCNEMVRNAKLQNTSSNSDYAECSHEVVYPADGSAPQCRLCGKLAGEVILNLKVVSDDNF